MFARTKGHRNVKYNLLQIVTATHDCPILISISGTKTLWVRLPESSTSCVCQPHRMSKTIQCAALPYRLIDGQPQVMLVTSRETRRWIIPKGWAKKKFEPCDMAAREAFEEAGVRGSIDPTPIGEYRYMKRMADGDSIACEVTVFLLRVEEELTEWPERRQRERQWMAPLEAARLVSDTDLVPILERLGSTVH
ncbi:NUDIX hydrolase [Niveispirillum irakense]|uniref:NUDIX hydrolase n=1 Tax=Niveispirillum irakense TaxID=34011 RepID=UPI00316AED30